MADAKLWLRVGLAITCLACGGCWGGSDSPLLIEQVVNQLKASGWSLIESGQSRGNRAEYWLRLTKAPNGTNVDLYVTSDKAPLQQNVHTLNFNVWSESKTSSTAIKKAISTATTRLTTVVPEAGSLIKSARRSKRQEMNEGQTFPIRWVGRSGSRSGWKAEVIEYTDHPRSATSRQQFSLELQFDG